jgi:hypothetical protein
MMIDRRTHRSEVLQEAVCLYFESVAKKIRASAIALASEDGLLVGGVGPDCNLDWLAALGSTGPLGRSERQDVVDDISGGQKLCVSGVCVHGAPFYLASLGPETPNMEETALALQRIFTPLFKRKRVPSRSS